jgi:type I site-specific restriction endonuclease
MALSTLLKDHNVARAEHKLALDKSVRTCVELSDAMQHNVRACVGIQLASVQSNETHLEDASKLLKKQITDMAKRTATFKTQYQSLCTAVEDISGLAQWLQQSDAALKHVHDNFATIQRILTSEM